MCFGVKSETYNYYFFNLGSVILEDLFKEVLGETLVSPYTRKQITRYKTKKKKDVPVSIKSGLSWQR